MNNTNTAARLGLLIAVLTIAGCTTQRASTSDPTRSGGTPVPPIYPEVATTPPVPRTPSAARSDTSVATLALLRDSEAAKARGDNGSAVAYVERAIRLEPRRADLWVELAKLQLPGKPVAAERYARKALALAGDSPVSQRSAWLVIADAKAARGDTQGATEIRDRYRTYKG